MPRPKPEDTLKPILEILAGVPTVVYGYFALTFMTPLLRGVFGNNTVDIYNTLSAGLVMGIMILPLVSSMSEDALSAVPRSLRDGAYGLGATRFETAMQVVVPAALSGIIAAFIIGVSRAVGETMIVAIAAGSGSNFTFNPFRAAETMTGYIARISGGDLRYDSPDYNSIFAIGLLLFWYHVGPEHLQPADGAPFPGGVRMNPQLIPSTKFGHVLKGRHRTARIWQSIFFLSTSAAILALATLLFSIVNQSFGYIIVVNKIEPQTLSSTPLDQLTNQN